MASTFKVPDEVREVLSRSVMTATSVTLPPEQLDRKLYEAVNKVFAAAGGRWDRKTRSHLFDRDPREALGLAVEKGEATNVKQALQAFYTPASVALTMPIELTHLNPLERVLEPSCGEGSLVQAVLDRFPAVWVHAHDIDPVATERLQQAMIQRHGGGANQVQIYTQDFLSVTPDPIFDAVVMNPPFTDAAYAKHVCHAFKFLRVGGRLVAIVPNGSKVSSRGPARKMFVQLWEKFGVSSQCLPAGTFKESGTNVLTEILVFQR